MEEVTEVLKMIDAGDTGASSRLLPLVYEQLRQLAASRMASEPAGNTLQPTALVHEAFLRLTDHSGGDQWNSRGHFFAAAAEAMRRILVENARRRKRFKRGGQMQRLDLDPDELPSTPTDDELLALNEALSKLEIEYPDKAAIVKLRYFAGLTNEAAAQAIGVSTATAQRYWTFARTWLFGELSRD